MAETKHTPGPWVINSDRYEPIGPDVVVLADDGGCGDPECCGPAYYWIEIKKEDAQLISTAPELLEALEGLLNALPSATTHPAIKAARAVIAKATGEQ